MTRETVFAGTARRWVRTRRPWANRSLVLAVAVALILGTCGPAARADTWTGAGQVGPFRSWTFGSNWAGGIVPPPADIDTFGIVGDGAITLEVPQSAAGLTFRDFTTTTIQSNPPPPPPTASNRQEQ